MTEVTTEVYPANARRRFVKSFALWTSDTFFGQKRRPWLAWGASVLPGALLAFFAISLYASKVCWVYPTILAATLCAVAVLDILLGAILAVGPLVHKLPFARRKLQLISPHELRSRVRSELSARSTQPGSAMGSVEDTTVKPFSNLCQHPVARHSDLRGHAFPFAQGAR